MSDLPELPRPMCCYADHSYPAYTRDQMETYARLAITRATPSTDLADIAERVREADVGALRYLLNWAESGTRIKTIMRTFDASGDTTQTRLERLWRDLTDNGAPGVDRGEG